MWHGRLASTTQALRWPRQFVRSIDGVTIESNIIPQWLKYATAEFAMYLFIEDRTEESMRDATGLKSIEVDVIKIEYQESPTQRTKQTIPTSVMNIVRPFCSLLGKTKYLVRC